VTKSRCGSVAAALLIVAASVNCGNDASTDTARADAVFAEWAKPGTPGCALGVLKDGKPIYVQGYGRADIEHSVPITGNTVFHIASVSKQFTAFAIYLLAQEGKLSLNDDVRKYLPELHGFDKTITISDLLHHTSGLRDQWNLLAMAGWRLEDVITQQDVVNLIWRQRDLNFHPGDEFLYSNTGYTLLGLIVERVSGRSLREFTDERIFAPLGMRSTHFHEHYGDLVGNRAFSYERQPDGQYVYIALSYSTVGPSSLFTTIDDLARWDENFYTGAVGGRDLLQKMQIKGHLNNGKEIDYASALAIGEYRGLRTVDHAGGDAGFRTELLRFPDEHFSVITLCNAADANAPALAHRVADIYLAPHLKGLPPNPPTASDSGGTAVKIDPKLLDAYVGDYQLEPDLVVSFTRAGDQLVTRVTGQPEAPVFPVSDRRFFLKVADAQVTFDAPAADGKSAGVTVHQDGHDQYAKRIQPAHLTPEEMRGYVGTFYSEELDALYTVSLRDDTLFVRYPRGELVMTPTTANVFVAPFPMGAIEYRCPPSGRCNGLMVTDGRVRKLRFDRVDLTPPGAR
jgi:CubicO group peptidase (beta-lactamase class C family)